MDKRFTLFAVLVALIFVVNQIVFSLLFPPKPAPPAAGPAQVAKARPDQGALDKGPAVKPQTPKLQPPPDGQQAAPAEAAAEKPAAAEPVAPAETPAVSRQWGTLGSADPQHPYRMLVTWTNQGAAIERLEMNSHAYRDLEVRSGYLGFLAPADAPQKAGALVRVVGAGTPAALAGLQPNDVITALGDRKIASATDLIEALAERKPRETIQISVQRSGATRQLTAELGRHPLAIIRPEHESNPVDIVQPNDHDPLSFLMTIQQFDDRTLADDNQELGGLAMRSSEWEVIAADQNLVSFRKAIPQLGLQVVKTYRLEKVPADQQDDPNFPAYHLWLDVSIANVGDRPHKVAYRLDGPTGLPIEGEWYANKVSRSWGGAGLRDVITHFHGGETKQISPAQLADPEFKENWSNFPLDYAAVDSQYFAVALLPQKENPTDAWFADVKPIRVGAVPKEKTQIKLIDVSFRLDSTTADLAPNGKPLEHRFQIFAGPKKPALLAQYGPPTDTLGDLVYYGWFGIVARPMLAVLHAFHHVIGNYGLAIIMLTVLVRGCMFPLSRKQALGAQKMQELQPEIKRINEKYKNEPEKKTRSTQELFRQHNYNPVGGCLLAFVQLPIFVGLYRSLMVDVELRQAPLFGDGIRWASNLAAPDMLWNWAAVMPPFITQGTGILGLGPYLNVLPLATIGLFIWQQKMFMPPPADEQAALQQKMMQYMMIFMGIMFFKVASGLCVYFIASSTWGICERKLLPKASPKTASAGGNVALPSASSSGNGAAGGKKRQRGRK